MKINTKILLSVFGTAVAFVGIVMFFLGGKFKEAAYSDAEKIADLHALHTARGVQASLNETMATVRTIANSVSSTQNIDYLDENSDFNNMLKSILDNNSQFMSSSVSWEFSEKNEHKYFRKQGRIRYTYFAEGTVGREDLFQSELLDTVNYDIRGAYYRVKVSDNHEFLVNPYWQKVDPDTSSDTIHITTAAVHIREDGQYSGLVGFDIKLDDLQEILQNQIPYKGSYIFLLANNGVIVAHSDKELVGKNIKNIFKNTTKIDIASKVEAGDKFNLGEIIDSGGENYITFAPVYAGNTTTPWSVGVSIPVDEVASSSVENRNMTIISGVLGFVVLIIIVFAIAIGITNSLENIIKTLKKLNKGNISNKNKLSTTRSDELGEVSQSLNDLIDTLNNSASFAISVGEGDYSSEFTAVDEDDKLGTALIEMRKNLVEAETERNIRLIENEKRSWAQTGVSEVGEILQRNYKTTDEMAYQLVSNLVKFLGATQGGIFFTHAEGGKVFLDLKAAYAFDRKKNLESKIELGESLVGRCGLEKELIYLTDVPQGYTYVTSGLGDETPSVLLLSPLISEQELYGVLEIAAFNKIEQYKIDFIKIISERIASVIANIKKNAETVALLDQSRSQSEELTRKEEETAKTISEMQKIQREILQRDNESQGIMLALISTASVVFYDMGGRILDINDKNLETFGYKKNNLIGKTQPEIFPQTSDEEDEYETFWNQLRAGKTMTKVFFATAASEELWLKETYTPIIGPTGIPEKVINIGIDITEEKRLERELNAKNID